MKSKIDDVLFLVFILAAFIIVPLTWMVKEWGLITVVVSAYYLVIGFIVGYFYKERRIYKSQDAKQRFPP